MCGGIVGDALDVVGINPATSSEKSARKAQEAARAQAEADQAEADQQASSAANARTQMQRKALRENSLLAGGGSTSRTTLGV